MFDGCEGGIRETDYSSTRRYLNALILPGDLLVMVDGKNSWNINFDELRGSVSLFDSLCNTDEFLCFFYCTCVWQENFVCCKTGIHVRNI